MSSPPVLPDHVKKPNEEEFKKTIEGVNASIEKLQKQFDVVKEKISKLPAKGDNSRREEIKSELVEIRDKQAELKKSRKAVYEQLDALNDSIRKKVSVVRSFQSKIPYKSTEEVDDRIAELERKIEAGMLQEISLLRRNRLSFEGIDQQQTEINRERAIYDELKKNIDDSEAKKLSDRYEQLDAEFKEIQGDQNKQREARNKLYDERSRLKGLLDEEYNKLRTLRDEHRKNNDEYYTFVRKLREYKKEQEQLRKVQEENEKRQEAAKQELELASLPAFENEIALCDNLAIFLESFTSSGSKNDTASSTNVNEIKNAFEGMVIKKRDDDVFFAGGNKKKQNKSKESAAKEGKKSDALKLPLSTMEAFFDIKVTVPTKISEIPATIQKLKERKEYFIKEQPKVTEANKKKAEERIQAILKAEDEEKEGNKKEEP
ncbi:hypothetical protein RO3G_16850 [Rhizopus delemar RA 99-880]|uniref:Nuclear segregation protein Bfr1 n=1 Tax=Rhizopus delemar (strain RA 99-880 / ATCC MYA-4621 / FGSC 9543 / NRRL 43880) TaxID=246409 RepID=I1CUK9_RHIO9|nr:hypothetical protein RO3G_16850 [Rhizopus delemar RA 99-880]|eukprot:EIE92139.1 hypothetical protein RO3G_16850 [Rhizopus delemar RA 99-880]